MAEVMTTTHQIGKTKVTVHYMDDYYRDASPEEIQRRWDNFDRVFKELAMECLVPKLKEQGTI